MKYNWNFYGSKDSIDKDIVIYILANELPSHREDRKRLVQKIISDGFVGNLMLAVVNDGRIIDCMHPSSADSLNNSVYYTYGNFVQTNECPITGTLPRNLTLAYYRTIHLLMSYLCRTHYRTKIRPIIHWSFKIEERIAAIKEVDFTNIETFNQKNTVDIDIWKKYAFYTVQSVALSNGMEIYDKSGAKAYEPHCSNFINRNEISNDDKYWLKEKNTELLLKKVNIDNAPNIACIDVYNKKVKADRKCPTLTLPHHNSIRLLQNGKIRKLTPNECEKIQTVPLNYTNCEISDIRRYSMLGNGWTVDVIAYILSHIFTAASTTEQIAVGDNLTLFKGLT